MLTSSVESRPARLRALMKAGTVALPGAFNAATALLAERAGFEALYISGAGIANGVAGVPDVGLLTMDEVAREAGYIADAVSLPCLCDADTGFGEPLNVYRTVQAFERAGIAGAHIEDQQSPKRCGHLSGKTLIAPDHMAEKVAAAAEARRDRDFLVVARTDARGVTGFDDAVARAHAYLKAGADAIFPEALGSREEFVEFARQVKAPLLANMTEFGRSPYLSVAEFSDLGYALVIFPMTAFRVAMKAVEQAYAALKAAGSQRGFLDRMQTRQELYDLVRYRDYEALDKRVGGYV
ncbi:MAG: methylisocitrate lyase [Candidatus Handelsmanbacteria bacterium RIFCSPLOWO2_12_FULL_64_10]|uniref:Methylisocitrate lyase n=1 Tax=Handelsmanbacteria sp. (strain RIFCSPLOWO2_12_FULL_64_10) TaxID=1817868 RepID=A0A1F6CQD7_HANXR|nr:MAG: methylisocitrate lyase [Candidatus Handelsmanbacteria bacterium RIFCSPLOWO2_12_FULL_64_10]